MARPRITAILCVRNEEGYLYRTLEHLVSNRARLIVIDNGSTDATPCILDEFASHLDIREEMPWKGEMDWSAIQDRKAALADRVGEGWIVNQDADEILEGRGPGESLSAALAEINDTDANVVNFDEFVFLPIAGMSWHGRDFRQLANAYYFHEPGKQRLMRMWRARAGIRPVGGGHRVDGEGLVVHPQNLVLRHYPFLSQDHARRKYCDRVFSLRDRSRGWHGNRVGLAPEDMEFPPAAWLKTAVPGSALDTSDPKRRHFWHDRRILRELGVGLRGRPER